MKRIFKLNIKKIIASLTATSLLISFVVGPSAASALNSDKNEEYKQIFKEFILPYSYGKITNAHYAGTDRVIINIQDLHCHPKVQKNIANIIGTFDKKFGVKKIYLEGAYGNVSTKWLLDKVENNKQLIDQMLDTGRLTGAEYYSALSGKTELIKGLEEKEPYLDNIKRLGKILKDQENIDLILNSLHECTDKVKKKYYTKRQYKLEKLFIEYKEGKIPSQKYYTLLSKHIDKLGIDLTKYENSLIYLTLLELQKDLNYKQITRDLQELVSVLKQQLPYSVYKSLLENTEQFKELEKLYSYIVQLDKTYQLNISSNFKELDKYFRYVELSKKINPVELVKEDEFLIQEINTRFAQTKAQQDVVFLTYFEKYLKDYLTTKITLDDYKYYQENINRYIQVYNKYVDNRVLSLLNEYIKETDKFYNINLDRNTYFTKNIFVENEFLNQIENTSLAQDDINKIIDNMKQVKELDIVVTGGFHSQTVTDLLKNKNVSYIVITPNVTDGIKLAEDTYYELAKEQSKIAFQTIAPVIASLSPQLQSALFEKIGIVTQEEISKMVSLDDVERAKVISELIAARLLESDDLGNVESKIQEVIKAVVDDLHKEKITPELISQIKNLQSIIKDREKLQKVIDLLAERTAKQSVMLVSDMFARFYTVFDSFIVFANKTLAQQEKMSSVKYIENEQTGKNDKKYYDEEEGKQEEISNNINEFFYQAEKNKTILISELSEFFSDTFEVEEETVNINKSNSFFYPTSTISFVVRDNKTHKEYKISIESFLNVTTMDFSMEIEGDSDREKYTPLLDTLAQNIMNGDLKIESKEEIKLKPEAKEKNRKIYYDEAEGKQEEISDNINRFFNRAETNELKIIPLLNEIFADTFEIKEETVNINKNNTPFYPTSTISFVVRDNKTHKEYKISIESFLNVTTMDFSIEIEGDSAREKYTPLLDKLAQEIMNGNFKIENKKEIKKEQTETSRKSYYDEEKEKSDKTHKNIRRFFRQVKSKETEIQEITNKINILFGDIFIIKEEKLIIDNNMYYPMDKINLVIVDKKTKKEYEISIVDFDNLGYMDFSIEIKGDSNREKYTPLLDKLAQDIMDGNFNFEIEEEVKSESEGKSRKIYYDEAEGKQEKTSRNINGFFNRAQANKTGILSLLNGIFADTFEIEEETVNINKNSNSFYPTGTVGFVVRDNVTHKEYKISMVSFLNATAMIFSIEIEGNSDREKHTALLDKLAQDIMDGNFNFEIEEEVKPESEGKSRKIYYDEAEEDKEEISRNINGFFNQAEKNKPNLISELSEFFTDTFEIEEETVNINKNSNPFYPTRTIGFVVRDNVTHKEYKVSMVSFLNVTAMNFSIEIGGDSDREEYTPLLDKLAQEIMNGNFKIDNITSKKETQNKAQKGNIKQLKREIIKAGKNNKDIVDFVSYLNRHNMADYELLNRILAELKKLEDWEIPEYCGVIYALTNKEDRKNDKQKALKTKENIMSFFEKSKLLQLKFGDLFSSFFKGYNDYINEDFFGALLDYVNKNEYDEQDFAFLFEICESSRFIAELGTKENIYAFLTLNMEKKIQIYEFYISSRDNFDIDINRLTLNFILAVAQKYNLSQEQFNYLMKLICMSNLMNTDIEKTYVDGLKEKNINMFVLNKIRKINVYNKYLLDLLFSDVDGKYIKNFDSKIQRAINLFDELQKYEIPNLETENKALALIIFFSDDFEKYCKDNNIKDIVKQYQLAIRVTRRIYSLSGDNIFDISQTQMEKIIDATLLYYKKIDEIISLISVFTNKTAVFSLYNSERSFDGEQRFTPTGLKEIFSILGINPEVCNFIEISFIDNFLSFINSMNGQDLNKKEILDFIDNLEGSIVVKETMKKYINSIKENTISKKNIIRYIEKTKEQQIENEIENFLGMLENFNKYGHKKGTFLFDGHGVEDGFFYSKNGKITIERLVKALITAHNNGVNLENITLMFSCCNSYDFAGIIVTKLINNGITVYPQIITDAGKETVYAYDRNIETSFGQTRVSNLFYSLLMFLKSKNSEEIKQMKGKLTFKEIADVPRYLSNNTIFMANKQISELTQELDNNIRQIIEEFDSEDKERLYPVMEGNKYVGAYNPYVEFQLPFTRKVLNKIGNTGIIKSVYKEKAGEKFRFTKFGVAIGTIIELFSFWSPNFIKAHNFDPSIQARMTAVVWVIRALSIGLGLATSSILALFLTETIAHFIWNISVPSSLMLQTPSQETPTSNEAVIEYTKNDLVTILLIKKADGTQYSVRLALNRIKEGETDYIRTGIPDKKMLVFLSSVNDDAYSITNSKYTTLEDIEALTGVKIEISENTIVVKTSDSQADIKYVKNKDISQIVSSLKTKPLTVSEQQQKEAEMLKTDSDSNGIEYIYLDQDIENNKIAIENAVKEKKLIVLYPFSNIYDIDNLTEEQLYALYFDIQNKFFELEEKLFSFLPKLKEDSWRTMAYVLKEYVKNAFVHGNLSDPSKPIYIKCDKENFVVYNAVNKDTNISERTKKKRLNLSSAATLTGMHRGLQLIQEYKNIDMQQETKTKTVEIDGKKKEVDYYVAKASKIHEEKGQITKTLEINYDKNEEDQFFTVLITKPNGDKVSIRFEPGSSRSRIYINSINNDGYKRTDYRYNNVKAIEDTLGIKINIDSSKITIGNIPEEYYVSYVKKGNIEQIVSKLQMMDFPRPKKEELDAVKNVTQTTEEVFVYLDDDIEYNKKIIADAKEKNKLIVLYPFSKTYDIDSLTDEQLYSLYVTVSEKFKIMAKNIFPEFPTLYSLETMDIFLNEYVKNAFVHGNFSDPSKPIYIDCSKGSGGILSVYNLVEETEKNIDVNKEKNKARRLSLATAAWLTGMHVGLSIAEKMEFGLASQTVKEIEVKIGSADRKLKVESIENLNYVAKKEKEKKALKIDFNKLINDVYDKMDLIEKTNEEYPEDRDKSMRKTEKDILSKFTPEELEIIDLLASAIFDSIKYVNSPRDTSGVEFANIIYALKNGLFNDNLLPNKGEDLKQHVLNMLEHYIDISKQKKGEENILVKAIDSNETLLSDMAEFLCNIIVKNNLIEKKKQETEQRKANIKQFVDGVKKDNKKFSAIMICSANENRSAIWHIMFEDFLKRTKRKSIKVFSAGVFYDISQEVIRQTGKARVLRDDYHDTLSNDERYRGVDEDIKSGFRSRYIKYLRLPKDSQQVFIVAGEQHRAQLIKLGYDSNWIFLMTEFYSDEFKTAFKQTHESLGKELEENNIFSMSEFPDPFEEQILRQDLPELVRSLVDYIFKTRDDVVKETLPEKFTKFTDDYNQFEHMENLPSFAFSDDEKREATRELYGDEVTDLVREKYQFEFRANTKYLYVLQNRNNKDALLDVVAREDAELKFKLFALMYLIRMRRGLTQEEMSVMNVAKDKMIFEFKKQLENNSFNVSNNFDLRAYMMGIYLLLQDDSLSKPVPEIIYNAFIINTDGIVLANSDGYFSAVDLFTIVHELTHVVVSKPDFYSKLTADTVDELVSYITPNMFLSIAKLSLKAYSKMKTGYTMHQTKGLVDYVKMGKKLHVLYNLFSDTTINRDLRQEEHSAPIAFLELLFNAHTKTGKTVDWGILLETIKTIDDESLDQSAMFEDILDTYIKMLVAKDKISKQEADNLIKEVEKMQMWTLLTYDIVQNIKDSDPTTYSKILGNKSAISFEEQILANPAKTKEYLEIISNAIKSKEQLSRNDILTLLIIDVISAVDYEQLINNFDGVTEGITNAVRIAAQMFDMQKGTYLLSEYEQIRNYVTENYTVTQEAAINIMGNIFDFIANSLDKLFFAKLLISQVFGSRDISSVLKDKKLLIVNSKQQEETLQQVLKDNNVEGIETVTMEIRTEPVTDIRSDMVLDVQRGIKVKYDAKENKLIVYSKQGITITAEEIQSLIMQEYFSERNEDVVEEDVIAFASATDTSLYDITNRLKTAYTASVTMPNKETKFDLSSRPVSNLITTCRQEFKATGIKTFVITYEQAKQFADEIKSLNKQDFKFIISCKSDRVVDITDYDGLLIDANEIKNLDQAINFMKSIKKKVLTQGVSKQISIKFNDEIYEQFEHLSMDIFNNFGIMPVINADKIRKVGRYEVENVTENNIELLLRSNNVVGLVIDNARIFVGKKSLIKQLFSKEHKYNKGYNAALSSKFDYICYDVPALAELLNVNINNEQDLNKIRNIDLSQLGLSSDALTYLEYLQKKDNYEEMTGFVRGIVMNTARTKIIEGLKEKGIELDIDKFAKEANGKYQKAFLTIAVQLMIEGMNITKFLETDFIDSNMTVKQYLDSVFEKVNINIEDILKQNEYMIKRTENTAKTIEDFKNYVVLLDNLKIVKETSANFDMSVKAVRSMLAAA